MVWEWSHSVEAYEAARLNIADLPRDELEVIYAEWKACPEGQFKPGDTSVILGGGFEDRRYARALSAARYIATDELAERIYQWAEKAATCSNGGWEAYVCPSGCHFVYFGRESFVCDLCGAEVARPTRDHEHDAGLCDECSAAFKDGMKAGIEVVIRQRDKTRHDREVGRGVVEEVVTGASSGVYLVGSSIRYSRRDGYERVSLPWEPHSRKQRIVIAKQEVP